MTTLTQVGMNKALLGCDHNVSLRSRNLQQSFIHSLLMSLRGRKYFLLVCEQSEQLIDAKEVFSKALTELAAKLYTFLIDEFVNKAINLK